MTFVTLCRLLRMSHMTFVALLRLSKMMFVTYDVCRLILFVAYVCLAPMTFVAVPIYIIQHHFRRNSPKQRLIYCIMRKGTLLPPL